MTAFEYWSVAERLIMSWRISSHIHVTVLPRYGDYNAQWSIHMTYQYKIVIQCQLFSWGERWNIQFDSASPRWMDHSIMKIFPPFDCTNKHLLFVHSPTPKNLSLPIVLICRNLRTNRWYFSGLKSSDTEWSWLRGGNDSFRWPKGSWLCRRVTSRTTLHWPDLMK